MRANTKKLLAGVAVIALFAGACGDDDETATDTGTGTENGTGSGVTITVTRDSIDVPAEIEGGVVEITVNNEAGADELDVSFVGVASGTSEEAFRTALLAAFEGEAIDESIESIAGVAVVGSDTATESVILEAGEFFVFSEVFADDGEDGEGDEDGGGSDTLLVAPVTVTEGEPGDLPETDGTITAVDYGFEIDADAGDSYTFQNDGPDQFHHGLVLNFGDLDPAVVEENVKAFLESEGDEDVPEALQPALEGGDPFVGGSSVFSPGRAGTFTTTLEAGTTYALVCFVSDRAGGPPHAFAYDMYEVFTVS